MQQLILTQGQTDTGSLLPALPPPGLLWLPDPLMKPLPLGQRLLFWLKRPLYLVQEHGPGVWRLLRGEQQTRRTWQAQWELQNWFANE